MRYLVGSLVDLAVQMGRLPDSSLIAKRIGQATHQLYAAPAYLAARGTPRKLADLAKHDVVLFRSNDTRWELTGPSGADHVDVEGRITGDNMQFVADAATAGLGIALLPTFIGDRLVDDGKLASLLPRFVMTTPAHLLAPGSRHLPRRVALVRDHMSTMLARECGKH